MIDVVGHHRPDDAQVVGARPDVRKELAYLQTGLAELAELPRRGQQLSRLAQIELRRGLAVILSEAGLGIECIDLRRSAGHEEKDHALGPRREMRPPGRQRIGARVVRRGGRAGCFIGQQRRQSQRAEPCARSSQHLAASRQYWGKVVVDHVGLFPISPLAAWHVLAKPQAVPLPSIQIQKLIRTQNQVAIAFPRVGLAG